MSAIIPASEGYPFPQINLTGDKLLALTESLQVLHFGYGLGAKIVPITQQSPDITGMDEHGNHVKEVDCSGFVRWAIYHATVALGPALSLVDGSDQQHEWFKSQGLKATDLDAALSKDGVVRIGFLTPADGGGVGHVLLCRNGTTMESHGSHGPDQRVLQNLGFARKMFWFVVKL